MSRREWSTSLTRILVLMGSLPWSRATVALESRSMLSMPTSPLCRLLLTVDGLSLLHSCTHSVHCSSASKSPHSVPSPRTARCPRWQLPTAAIGSLAFWPLISAILCALSLCHRVSPFPDVPLSGVRLPRPTSGIGRTLTRSEKVTFNGFSRNLARCAFHCP